MATLAVYVTPKSAEDKLCGWCQSSEDKPELLIKLRAAPTDGKANSALIKLLADELGIPKRAITLKRGHASRHKVLQLDMDQACLLQTLERLLPC